MRFIVERTELSENCRRFAIKPLLKKRMEFDQVGLFAEVEAGLRALSGLQDRDRETADVQAGQKKGRVRRSERIRRDLRNLLGALASLGPDTIGVLADSYWRAYPFPRVSSGTAQGRRYVELQVLKEHCRLSHIMRTDSDRTMAFPVPVDELIARVRRACEVAEKRYQPPQGAPPDEDKVAFIMCLVDAYEYFTKTKATSRSDAPFDTFSYHVIADASGGRARSVRRPVRAAVVNRREVEPVKEAHLRYFEVFEKTSSDRRAPGHMLMRVPPIQARYLELVHATRQSRG
ncbi:hypothetical protein ACFLSJ_00355 [Verrucomicrobiota bacterium]